MERRVDTWSRPFVKAGWIRTVLVMTVLVMTVPLLADDWTQFRGTDRDGTSAEKGLHAWTSETGPREVWRRPIGSGYSGITAVEGRLFTMDSDGEKEYAVALDAATGSEAWRVPVGGLFRNDFGDGPRSTPTYDDGKVYTVASLGHLNAHRASDGKILWTVSFKERFGSELPQWAFSSAPLVFGELLIVEVGGKDGPAVAAFNKATGDVVWTAHEGELAYSSPIAIDFGGVRQIVVMTKGEVFALDGAGKTLWRTEFVPELGIKPAPPVFVAPDLLFVSASYDAGAKAFRLSQKDGKIVAEDAWETRFMRNHFNGSVALDGHLIGFDKATLKCLDAATGEMTWAKRGLGKGSLIRTDDLLIILGERGQLVLAEADTAAYTELASHPVLSGRTWTQPTLAGGHLYLRDQDEIVSLDLTAGAGGGDA